MDEMWPLVEAQHGVFARWQATARGITVKQLAGLVRPGVLEVVTNRVLRACGAPRTPEQAQMIAVLHAGPEGAASRRSAGWLWGLPNFPPMYTDVVRPRDQLRGHAAGGHWPRLLPEHHLTVVRGIPATTLARTVFDLAGMRQYANRVGVIIDYVDRHSPSLLVAMHQMLPELAKQGRNGIVVVRDALSTRPPDRIRVTGLERRFEHILASAGISLPRRQVDLGGHSRFGRVDYYDDFGVIYEIDSSTYHTSLTDRRNDAMRDAAAIDAGFNEVVRIPEEHVWYEPHLAREAVLNARRRWRSSAA